MNTNKETIGIDLGDREHRACVLSAAGDIVAGPEITNTRERLTFAISECPGFWPDRPGPQPPDVPFTCPESRTRPNYSRQN